MHFLTDEEWELRDPILKSLQGIGTRMYPYVEVGFNAPLWHLDILTRVDGQISCWRRFLLASIDQVAATLAEHDGHCRLHFQDSRQRDEGFSYELHQVEALFEGMDVKGRHAYVVALPHRRIVYPDRSLHETVITDLRCLFQARLT